MRGGWNQKEKRSRWKSDGVSNRVDGVHVDPNGEGRLEREQVKNSRRQSEAPGEEGEESESPKRKTIRVESEETQDYVREANDMDQEEAEEISFVPSAMSVPQKPLFRCDNQCSEKKLSFWQLASVVIEEGEKSCTTNLCQQCYNESLEAEGDKLLSKWKWYEFEEKKAHRGRLWKMMGKDQYVREMWTHFCQERAIVKRFREEAQEERQAGIQGQWQLESPAR